MTQKVATNTIGIEKGQYLPLPDTTEYVVGGPARVEVTRYDTGTVTVDILDGKSVPTRLAIAQKWERIPWGV